MPGKADPGGTNPKMSDTEWVELKQRIGARLELVINLPRRPAHGRDRTDLPLRIPTCDLMIVNVAHLLEV